MTVILLRNPARQNDIVAKIIKIALQEKMILNFRLRSEQPYPPLKIEIWLNWGVSDQILDFGYFQLSIGKLST